MSSAERVYRLLPAVLRLRDAAQGGPLEELLAVIAEEVELLEEDVAQLLDDQFIETCADWAVPYIGDLVGYRLLHGVVPGVASPRAEVANTVRFRRRKGTASMLEQLAHDVTGWPARVVEAFQLVATTQSMNHLRPAAPATLGLREAVPLELAGGAFGSFAHTAEVRSPRRGGRYNVPNVGIFLWRLRAFTLTASEAVPADGGGRRFRFNPLGIDGPLFTAPRTEEEITHFAQPLDVPLPITRRLMAARLEDYYGPGRSVHLELAGAGPEDATQPIPLDDIEVADLSDVEDGGGMVTGWAHAAPAGKVALDPLLGRVAFDQAPATSVRASFRYGFSAGLGGGEYDRSATLEPVATVRRVSRGGLLQPELDAAGSSGGVVEIVDSARYEETLAIAVDAGRDVVLRAADGARPLVLLASELAITGGPGSTLELSGLVIAGGVLRLAAGAGNALARLRLSHCTLVPGILLGEDGAPAQPGAASLVAELADLEIEIDHCILGGLRAAPEVRQVTLRDSVLDATDPAAVAFAGLDDLAEGGPLSLAACTAIGKLHARRLEASNCVLHARRGPGDGWQAPVWVERKQEGCVRFSYLPFESLAPRRYQCQPVRAEQPGMRPQFTSLRFGDPGYVQLARATPDELRRGADDEGEMGALHSLYAPQREVNLRVRLDEYLRFGLEAGIFHAT